MRGLGRKFQRGPIWWVAYWHRGQEFRESTKSTDPRKADKLLVKRTGDREAGTFVGVKEERVTYAQLEQKLLDDYALNSRRSTYTLKIRLAHLRETFGSARAVDITADRIHAYQARRRKTVEQADGTTKPGASAATVNRELAALRRMFTLALKHRLLTRPAYFPDRLEENAPRQGFLEHADYLAIREQLDPDYADVLDFGYFSGWRLREITGLTWGEVFLDGGEIRLDPARSKTKRPRTLRLSAPLRALMGRRLAARRLDTGLVFHHRKGKPVGDWRKSWHSATEAAGRPGTLFHDLRRTVARNLIRANVSEKVSMEITGHATPSVFKRYNISTDSDRQAAVDKLAAYTAQQPTRPSVVPMRAEGAS
jgi:integrase